MQNQRTLVRHCSDLSWFTNLLLVHIWRIYANMTGYHSVITDLDNLIIESKYPIPKQHIFSKKKSRDVILTHFCVPSPRSELFMASCHPKRRSPHKRSAALCRHPMERNQWRRYQIQPLFPSEHKGPWRTNWKKTLQKKNIIEWDDTEMILLAGVKVLRIVCVR